MKKINKVLLSVLAVFGMVFMANQVKAEELKSDFMENLCVTKKENVVLVTFDLKKELDLSKEGWYAGIRPLRLFDKQEGTNTLYGGMCNNGICDTKEVLVVTDDITCGDTEVSGTVLGRQKLAKGTTIAIKYTIVHHKEDFLAAKNIHVEFELCDDEYNYEYVTYNVQDQKMADFRQGVDKFSAVITILAEKYGDNIYPNWYDSETSTEYFGYTVRLSEDQYMYRSISVIDKDKTIDEIVAEVEKQILGKKILGYIWEESTTVSSEALSSIKSNGYQATFEYEIYDEGTDESYVAYSWTFDGSQMEAVDYDLDLSLTIGSGQNKEAIESLVKNKEKSLVLEFAHHGELPKGTTVKVYVGNKYSDGEYVALYYYNEETKALEEVATGLEVKDGYVEFGLEHCSEYVLQISTKPEPAPTPEVNPAPNNAQTSSMNVVLYIGLAVASLLGIAYLIVSKKKEA